MPLIDTEHPDVSQVMLHPEMLRAYEAHLDSEFSSENMAFLRAVDALQAKANDLTVSDAAIKDEAAAIYAHYMKKDATREVNLKATNINGFHAQMENLATLNRQQTLDMFNACHEEITGLISRDSFGRFVSSGKFKEAAEKVESNHDVETRIGELRTEADKALKNPTLGDRMKTTVGAKTKAQELTEQADKLQRELEPSRQLKPLDVPPTNTQQVIADTAVLAQQQRVVEAAQAAQLAREIAARQAREEAERIPPPPPDELDVDNSIPPPPPDELDVDNSIPPPPPDELDVDNSIPPPPPDELDVDNSIPPPPPDELDVDNSIPPPPPDELDQVQAQHVPLAPPQVGQGVPPPTSLAQGQGQGQGTPPLAPRGPQVPATGPQVEVEAEGSQMEVEEMSMEEIGEIGVGTGRERSRGMGAGVEGGEIAQTRDRGRALGGEPPGTSVRDSLGRRDGPTKQGQGGPKVK